MAKLFKTTFKLRRGSSEVWDKNNPVLAYGEPGFDKDKYTFKIGDGKKHWKELKPIGATVQADWDQNDDTQPDYIKNRLAYTEGGFELGALIGEEVCMPDSMPTINIVDNDNLVEGKCYRFTINSIAFDMQCKVDYHEGYPKGQIFYFGDVRPIRAILIDQNQEYAEKLLAQIEGPFYFGCRVTEHIDDETNFVNLIAYVDETLISSEYTFSVHELIGEPEIVHKIDPKYYDRLAWTEEKQKVLIPLQEVNITTPIVSGANFGMNQLNVQEKFTVGSKYAVVFDGATYECICKHIDEATMAQYGMGAMDYIGNESLFMGDAGENTGEPFIVAHDLSSTIGVHGCFAALGTHAVSVHKYYEEVHKIDPKFYDRLAWEEMVQSEILPTTTITIADSFNEREGLFGLKEGQTYIVNWDGTEYECGCISAVVDGATFAGIGNLAAFELGDDTGEPFLIADVINAGFSAIVCMNDGDYTVSISTFAENIHKIEEKYLPKMTWDKIGKEEKVLYDLQLNGFSENGYVMCVATIPLVVGQKYEVVWDGVSYITTCYYTGNAFLSLGNPTNNNGFGWTDEPFTMVVLPIDNVPYLTISAVDVENKISNDKSVDTHSVIIKGISYNIIDKNYLPKIEASELLKVENAEVGQVLVVKTVDEDGNPTEWEAVNLKDDIVNSVLAALPTWEGGSY